MRVVKRRWSVVLVLSVSFFGSFARVAAQSPKIARIGFLTLISNPDPLERIFLQSLKDLGYVEGQNMTIQYRRAAGKVEDLPRLANELIRLKPDLIVVRATPVVQAAKNATTTIPLVMVGVGDPVRSGFVSNLAQPGGNITGLSNIQPELAGKRLEILKELRPRLSTVGFLAYKPDPLHAVFLKDIEEAAETWIIRVRPAIINTIKEIEPAISNMTKERMEALIVQPLFISNLGQGPKIVELAIRNGLPTVSDFFGFAELGGLLFYGPDQKPMFQRAATYVDKILKGSNPGDLPVEQPTKFELVINLKTAKQIGLTIPPNVLARADRVIK